MRVLRCLLVAGLFLGLAGVAQAQNEDRERLRRELIERLDKKLQTLREEMVREIDRALEGRGRRPSERRTDPAPAAGSRPFLGVTLKPLSEGARTLLDIPEGVGVMVEDVQPDSAAAKAGIVSGDVILAWNGKDIAGAESLAGFVRASKVGDEVKLTILHRGTKKEVPAVLGGVAADRGTAPPARRETPRGEESLEDFLRRVLEKEGGEDDDEQQPFAFGNPGDLQKMMEKMFSDPEAMREMQKQAEEMMRRMFGGDPEQMEQFQKQAEEMMRRMFGDQEGPDGQQPDLREMLEKMMGRQGGEEEGPGRQEEMDRLNKMLDEVLKGAQGEEKKVEAPTATTKGGAFLGLSLRPISPAVRSQMNIEEGAGVMVAGVLEDGPAARGGIERFDILVSVDGTKVGSVEDLAAALASKKAGDEVAVGLVRKGSRVEKKVVLGSAK